MSRQEEKTLYLECSSGISGDMMVAALLDLGADAEVLNQALESLSVPGFRTEITRVKKAGLDVCDFNVILEEGPENHDHDMTYLHGPENPHTNEYNYDHDHEHSHEHSHDHSHSHEHSHDHDHEHSNDHGHDHSHEELHSHDHIHRGMPEIRGIIEHSDLTANAKHIALHIFEILAKAEAKAHGVAEEQVHFHEVGAVDSIVDIAATAVCLDNLGIKQCIIPVLCEGCGTVRCQHGVLPIPVPAVANIAQMYDLNLSVTNWKGEFVTPTGAAIAAAIRTADTLPETFSITKIGMGGGKREYERPSILRAMLIEQKQIEKDIGNSIANAAEDVSENDCVWKLESNIDDCSGEMLGYAMDRLFEAGAKDVHYMPVYMKKNRPAYQLNVLCAEADIPKLEQIIFEETTTIGIRRYRCERSVLKRRQETIKTSLGEISVKVCTLGSEIRRYPEYNSVAELCKKHGKSYQEVYHLIIEEMA